MDCLIMCVVLAGDTSTTGKAAGPLRPCVKSDTCNLSWPPACVSGAQVEHDLLREGRPGDH